MNALHPGTFLDSGMVRESGIQPLGPVSRGAEAILEVVRRSLEGVTGQYFDGTEPARPDAQANDSVIRAELRERTDGILRPFLESPWAKGPSDALP